MHVFVFILVAAIVIYSYKIQTITKSSCFLKASYIQSGVSLVSVFGRQSNIIYSYIEITGAYCILLKPSPACFFGGENTVI